VNRRLEPWLKNIKSKNILESKYCIFYINLYVLLSVIKFYLFLIYLALKLV